MNNIKDFYERRLTLLKETDMWGLADYPATAEQLAYRQALRDMPSMPDFPIMQEQFPFAFAWPTKPE